MARVHQKTGVMSSKFAQARVLNYHSIKLRDKLDQLRAIEVFLEIAAYLLSGLPPYPARQLRK
jgi:hypothetical protein